MFVAALIVLVIAILLLLVGILGGRGSAVLDFGWFRLDADVTVSFILGMVCLALFAASWKLFRSGARHAISRRRDRKQISQLNSQLEEYRKDPSQKAAPEGDAGGTAPGTEGKQPPTG